MIDKPVSAEAPVPDINHTRDCVLPSDGRAEGLVKASELFALSAERDRLTAENERLRALLNRVGQSFGFQYMMWELREDIRAALKEDRT
jgi:hypothetical protein